MNDLCRMNWTHLSKLQKTILIFKLSLWYNKTMSEFKYYYPIQVRYGDLDPQWHVNNSRFSTYIEQARFVYLIELGLFDGKAFLDLPFIVADVHISYLAPITMGQKIQIGVRVSRMGTKSLTFEYQIEDQESRKTLATAETILVTYDYRAQKSIPIPENIRKTIAEFESIPAAPEH